MKTEKLKVGQSDIEAAAARLMSAHRTSIPCAPVRDLIGTCDEASAYAVQELVTEGRIAAGHRVVGRKIGLTSFAVQSQFGVDQPDFGVLFDTMNCHGAIPAVRLIQPKVEAEIAFVLKEDLVDGPLDTDQVRAASDYAVSALEIVDSRIADWDITFADTVADNASSGMYVLGSERVSLNDFEPVEVVMEMTVDDAVVSAGVGSACLGDPLNALVWLARKARELGSPLRSGQLVLSGALGPMAEARPGSDVVATIRGLGTVAATFGTRIEDGA